MDPRKRLDLAREQLAKVQAAWLHPTDWADVTTWGMHACENAIVAAADKAGLPTQKTHPNKAAVAQELSRRHQLPNVDSLLQELNELRKGFNYGEPTVTPSMSAEDIASEVEQYIEAVAEFLDDEESA